MPDDDRPPPDPATTRREFLRTGIAGMAAGAAAASGCGTPAERDPREPGAVQPLPEEFWAARMQAPDDGQRYGWIVDARRCFGCHACEVSCKAENDVPLGHYIRQTIYHDYTHESGQHVRVMVPMACQHCEDAPCIKVCPCGALAKGAGGSVQVDYDRCSGHGDCVRACPYGAIYLDPVAQQAVKCHNCTHRLEHGLEPACVSTCPSEALYFGDLADPHSTVSKLKARLAGQLETLRPEKGTRPRMQFVTDERHAAQRWAHRIPAEGQSYSPEAYDVYAWERAAEEERK